MPENIVIENNFTSITISPDAGASLRSFLARKNGESHELLVGGTEPHNPTVIPNGTGSFIMAPWVNRVRDGRLMAPDGIHNLPINAPPHAMHGLLRQRPWSVNNVTGNSVQLKISLDEPWPYSGDVEYTLKLDGRSTIQTMKLTAAPEETRPFPGGLGWHPWFNRTLGTDQVQIRSDVLSQWDMDETMTAQGTRRESEATGRLRRGTRFKTDEIDGCFLARRGGKTTLSWPEITLTMTGSATVTHLMFYSPGHAICVEPQTTTIDAARLATGGVSDTGHVLVDPDNPLIATVTWSWGD